MSDDLVMPLGDGQIASELPGLSNGVNGTDGANGGPGGNGVHLLIRPVSIEQEMRNSYLDYAMSVIVARALPDARDGGAVGERARHPCGSRSGRSSVAVPERWSPSSVVARNATSIRPAAPARDLPVTVPV